MTEGRRETHKRTTREALADAALRRFANDGYDETSVETIAADAGVSARTFFRYFATKDEVLDMGREARQAELRAVVGTAGGTGLDVVRPAVLALAAGLAGDRDRVALRQRAAASSPVLRGRLFDTFASWEHALAVALRERDEPEPETLAAVGIAVFRAATARWLDSDRSLPELVEDGFDVLRR